MKNFDDSASSVSPSALGRSRPRVSSAIPRTTLRSLMRASSVSLWKFKSDAFRFEDLSALPCERANVSGSVLSGSVRSRVGGMCKIHVTGGYSFHYCCYSRSFLRHCGRNRAMCVYLPARRQLRRTQVYRRDRPYLLEIFDPAI